MANSHLFLIDKPKKKSFLVKGNYFVLLTFLILLLAWIPSGSIFAWILLMVNALISTRRAVESLVLSMLLIYLNPAIFEQNDLFDIMRWVVVLFSFFRVFIGNLNQYYFSKSWLKWGGVFAIYLIFSALFFAPFPILSLLKVVSIILIIFTTYFGAKENTDQLITNLIWLGLIIAGLSGLVIFSGTGYLRNGTQFQGILSHPQSFSVILSILFSAQIGRWFFSPKPQLSLVKIAISIYIGVLLYLSGGRSGYFAVFLAVALTLFLYKKRSDYIKRIFTNPITYFLGAFLILYFGFWGNLSFFDTLIFEREASDYASYDLPVDVSNSRVGLLIASRSTLIDASLINFRRNPVWGIGFGTPSNFSIENATYVGGIPISLPNEKGSLLPMILEEIGLVGTALFGIYTLSQFRFVSKTINPIALTLFLVAIFVNMGEAIYFSTGGIGILIHVCLGIGLNVADSDFHPKKSNRIVISESG